MRSQNYGNCKTASHYLIAPPVAQSRMAEVSNTRETRAIAQIPPARAAKRRWGEPCRMHHRDGRVRMVPMHGPACCRERRAANQGRAKRNTSQLTHFFIDNQA